MITGQIRKQLDTIKIHIDELDRWIRNATDMIYEVEEKIFDIEDGYNKEYTLNNSMKSLEEAASGIHHIMECPPRLKSRRRDKQDIAAVGFNQHEFRLNYLFNQQDSI